MTSRTFVRCCFMAIAILFCRPTSHGAEYVVKTQDKASPGALGAPIRALLQPKAIQLLDGDKTALEFWLRAELPLKSKPSSESDSLTSIAETAFVGAISFNTSDFRDYKDNEIPKGVYTARFGLQPQDGDHLGTAEFNYFLILLPADSDKEPGAISQFKPMVKASGKLTPSGHPVVLSLRPAPAGGPPKLVDPVADHKAIRVGIHAKVSNAPERIDLGFDLVYQGKGHIQ